MKELLPLCHRCLLVQDRMNEAVAGTCAEHRAEALLLCCVGAGLWGSDLWGSDLWAHR